MPTWTCVQSRTSWTRTDVPIKERTRDSGCRWTRLRKPRTRVRHLPEHAYSWFMVVTRRPARHREALVALLRAFRLEPVLFRDALADMRDATPYVGDVLER